MRMARFLVALVISLGVLVSCGSSKMVITEDQLQGTWEHGEDNVINGYATDYMYEVVEFHDGSVRDFDFIEKNGGFDLFENGTYAISKDQITMTFNGHDTVFNVEEENGKLVIYYWRDIGQNKQVKVEFHKNENLNSDKDYAGTYYERGLWINGKYGGTRTDKGGIKYEIDESTAVNKSFLDWDSIDFIGSFAVLIGDDVKLIMLREEAFSSPTEYFGF